MVRLDPAGSVIVPLAIPLTIARLKTSGLVMSGALTSTTTAATGVPETSAVTLTLTCPLDGGIGLPQETSPATSARVATEDLHRVASIADRLQRLVRSGARDWAADHRGTSRMQIACLPKSLRAGAHNDFHRFTLRARADGHRWASQRWNVWWRTATLLPPLLLMAPAGQVAGRGSGRPPSGTLDALLGCHDVGAESSQGRHRCHRFVFAGLRADKRSAGLRGGRLARGPDLREDRHSQQADRRGERVRVGFGGGGCPAPVRKRGVRAERRRLPPFLHPKPRLLPAGHGLHDASAARLANQLRRGGYQPGGLWIWVWYGARREPWGGRYRVSRAAGDGRYVLEVPASARPQCAHAGWRWRGGDPRRRGGGRRDADRAICPGH